MRLKSSTLHPFLALDILCILCNILPYAFSAVDFRSDGRWWCDRTPYPSTCTYYMSHVSHPNPLAKEHLHTLSLQVAMDQALLALSESRQLGSEPRDDRARPAWSDCHELVASTVRQLNRTIGSSSWNPNSGSDMLTWLSAARTNLNTCETGFAELNLSPGSAFPDLLSNVSRFISYALAVTVLLRHKKEEDMYTTRNVTFPNWLSSDNRKLWQGPARPGNADLVVSKDGTGDFRSVREAVEEAARRSTGNRTFVVHVKEGVYNEYVRVGVSNLMLVGDGIGRTVITGSRSVRRGYTTFSSATFAVDGERFIARGITFQNTAGPAGQQAVALRASADLSAFYQCSFEGHQDTLYAHTGRQFYRECDVSGTVDFIFGNAAAVLQRCNIYVRRPLPGQPSVITAQGRASRYENTGIAIHGGRVSPEKGGRHMSYSAYLGRPWKEYSRAVYMETYMDGMIDASGWLAWNGTGFALGTVFYGEYKNSGPGSDTSGRVRWKGYHAITDAGVASKFTAGSFVDADSWLPSTGVPFTPGL